MLKTIQLVFIILVVSICRNADAVLKGPIEIIRTTWGHDEGQFYFWEGESHESFPKVFGVDKYGYIVIPDPGNRRIVIYDQKGSIKHIVTKPAELPALDNIHHWPTLFGLDQNERTILVDCDYQRTRVSRGPTKMCSINYNGKLVRKTDTSGLRQLANPDAVPPEIRSTQHKIPEDWYRESRSGTIEFKDGEEFIAEYGSVVEAPNGDVYIWKRTPTHYSVLKWTWVDDEKLDTRH